MQIKYDETYPGKHQQSLLNVYGLLWVWKSRNYGMSK